MDEELLRLAQQAESAGYTTSEQIVNEDSQVIAACIWLMHPTLVGVHPRGETDETGRS